MTQAAVTHSRARLGSKPPAAQGASGPDAVGTPTDRPSLAPDGSHQPNTVSVERAAGIIPSDSQHKIALSRQNVDCKAPSPDNSQVWITGVIRNSG